MYSAILLLCLVAGSEQLPMNSTFLDFMESIPQGDLIGVIVNVLDNILNNTHRNSPSPKSSSCIRKLLNFGENEVVISAAPRGVCSYCCTIHKPSNYIRLYFSSKGNSTPAEIKLKYQKNTLRSAGVNASLPTVIFIHGFMEYGLGPSPKQILNAYLSLKEDHNIFLVDWGDLSTFPWYPQASKNTLIVGKNLGKFLAFYNDTGELPISKVHVIGFSLGAHIAGYIGRYLLEHGYEMLPRITALDPALPTFEGKELVSKNDARFVDVIHTDGGKFGVGFSLGHVDFYPNGGSFVQPGCELSSLAEQKMIDQLGYCGHLRAWQFYAESVRNPRAFPSFKVSNMRKRRFLAETFMGYSVNTQATGDYFLITNNKVPFSKTVTEQKMEIMKMQTLLSSQK